MTNLGTQRVRRRRPHPDNRIAALFMTPWMLGLLGITLLPMVASLVLSFTDYSLIGSPHWTGLENVRRMLHDARLHHSLVITVVYVLVGTPLQLALALAIGVASVSTSTIGRPRRLSRHRRAHPTTGRYTLVCEEPDRSSEQTIAWKWERPIAIVRAPSSAMERGGGSSAFRSA